MHPFVVTALACWMALPASEPLPPLRAGAATSNITPPLGGDIIGGFAPFPATHVHDELHARCLVLDDGQTRLALVVCDLLGIHRLVSDEARRIIQETTGIPPQNVLVSATHTHSACSALGNDRVRYEQELDDYQRFVARRIADGVRRAVHDLRPARIGFGRAQAPEHVFNRRWFMKPGSIALNPFGRADLVKMNPSSGSPDLEQPAGPTDPIVSFISLVEPSGRPIALFAAYSLHYVGGVGSGHVSADYFGMFCEHLTHLLGAQRQDPPFVAMMANGTSGDINNINFRQPRPRQEPYAQMRHVAHDVAEKVHAALAQVEYRDHARLDARFREPLIACRRPDKELVEWAQRTLAERAADPRKSGSQGTRGKADLPAIYAQRTLRMADYPESIPIPLQVLRIGEICLGTMPCEVFCEIGLEFKERCPLQPAFMVSLNHGYYGYLPTPRQHEWGGYETWLGTNRLERNASEKMLSELLEMAAQVKESSGAGQSPRSGPQGKE